MPNRHFWRGSFEWSEFPSHLFRCGGGGTPLGPRTGGNGFEHFCRNPAYDLKLSGAGGRIHYHFEAHVLDYLLDFVGWVAWGGEVVVDEEGFSV